jgi:hypothetical protein
MLKQRLWWSKQLILKPWRVLTRSFVHIAVALESKFRTSSEILLDAAEASERLELVEGPVPAFCDLALRASVFAAAVASW